MKNALRLIALLLVFATLAISMVACGDNTDGGENDGDKAQTSGEGDENMPVLPDETFNDYEVRFIIGAGTPGEEGEDSPIARRSIAVDEDADMGYNVNKAVKDRNTAVEDKLGVKIVIKQGVGMQEMGTVLGPILLSGLDEYDVVAAYQYFDLGLCFGQYVGTFLNYNKIDESEMFIDPTKPYWDGETFNELAYKGAAYWITGDLSQAWVGTMFVSYVNARIWNQYAEQIEELTEGYSDIYELVYAGKWTLDLWCDLCQTVYVDSNANDTVDREDQVGYISYKPSLNTIMTDGLAAGSHITYTEWVDGIPQVNFYNAHSIEFAEKLYRLSVESQACLTDWVDGMYIMDMFAAGNIMMTVSTLVNAENYLADMQDDYYIVPVPKLNEAQTDYYTVIGDSVSQYGIPVTCPNVAATTATLEYMAYLSKKDVTPAFYDVALKERYTRDPKAGDMIDFIHDTVYSDFVMVWSNQVGNCTWYFREHLTDKRFTSSASGKNKQWQKALDKLLANLENSTYVD